MKIISPFMQILLGYIWLLFCNHIRYRSYIEDKYMVVLIISGLLLSAYIVRRIFNHINRDGNVFPLVSNKVIAYNALFVSMAILIVMVIANRMGEYSFKDEPEFMFIFPSIVMYSAILIKIKSLHK